MKTILLIEDHELLRLNTAEMLGLAGYAVQAAADGQAGLNLAQTHPPDLVVCDIMMPLLDGYGVLACFRQTPRLAGVPFLFLTAKIDRADQRHGMALGADDYLTKPFQEAELLSAISGRLHRFRDLQSDYDLSGDGLHEFLTDARAVGQLE
ncbi:MAG: response regulator, partial [Hymenobacter sp.]|nr:response regulator [Hymenobacter sp.]